VPRFHGEVLVERRSRVVSAIGAAWFLLLAALAIAVSLNTLSVQHETWLALALMVSPLALLPLQRRFARRSVRSTAIVRIDQQGIWVDDKLVLRRERIHSGATHALAGGEVRVVFKGRLDLVSAIAGVRSVSFLAPSASHARTMLESAGVDAERRILTTVFLRPRHISTVALAAVIFVGLSVGLTRALRYMGAIAGTYEAMLVALLTAVVVLGGYVALIRAVLVVGTDGLEMRQAFRIRYVPFDQVADVTRNRDALVVVLRTGESIHLVRSLPIEPVGSFGESDLAIDVDLLRTRIVDAMHTHERSRRAFERTVLLGRNSRSATEWLASLRALGEGEVGYRTNSLPVEELRRIVSDSNCANDVRVGAAVALRVVAREDAVSRIRVAAETTASPELRRLLNDIADEGDDERLERYLSQMP
jgi:hypothetical protein